MHLLKKAIEAHQTARLDHAEKLYGEFLLLHPKDPEALRLLGMLHWQKGQLEKAESLLRSAVDAAQPTSRLLGNLGLVLQQRGQLEAAIGFHRRSLALESTAATWSNLGVALRKLENHAASRDALSRAVALEPENQTYLLNLCTTLRLSNQAATAAELLRRHCDANPPNARLFSEYARVLLEDGRLVEAEKWIYGALKLQTRDPSIWINLGLIHKANANWEAALNAFEQSMMLSPLMPEAFVLSAQVLNAQSRHDAVLSLCAEGFRYFPSHLPLHLERLSALVDLEDLDRAQSEVDALLGEHDTSELWLQKAFIHLEKSEKSAAGSAFEECLRIDPDHVHAVHFLNAVREKVPCRIDPRYVERVFDDYAPTFDEDLMKALQYRVPELVEQALVEHCEKTFKGVDLGCGTGLLGPLMRPYVERLVGLDLSKNMLRQARVRGCYDQLLNMDVQGYLLKNRGFDLMVAGDVFIYVSDLTDVVTTAFDALNPHGMFIFTVERVTNSDKAVILSVNGRFQHHVDHVKNILLDLNFSLIEQKFVKLRKESGRWVDGVLFVLKRSGE